jgi:tetratricopeptide (TPR) repeat protein
LRRVSTLLGGGVTPDKLKATRDLFETVALRDARAPALMIGYASTLAMQAYEADPADRAPLLDRAESLLIQALAVNPLSAQPLFWLGAVRAARDDLAGALELMHITLALEPAYAPALAQIGHVKLLQGNAAGAIVDLDRALTLSPASAARDRWHWFAGMARLLSGDTRGAVDNLREAVTYNPALPGAQAWLAAALAQSGDVAGARAAYAAFRHLIPDARADRRFLGDPVSHPAYRAPIDRAYTGLRQALNGA